MMAKKKVEMESSKGESFESNLEERQKNEEKKPQKLRKRDEQIEQKGRDHAEYKIQKDMEITKEDAILENKRLAELRRIPKPVKEVLKVMQDGINNFSDPDIMLLIQKELQRKHIGNEIASLLTFVGACNSRLKPEYRASFGVRGGSSEGKTDMVKTMLLHFPEEWYIFGTRFTRATIEDDVEKTDLIVILEKPKDSAVVEALKQLAEDGLKIWKKEATSDGTHKLKDTKFIPRKTLMYTTTEDEEENELANRLLFLHIEKDKERYKKVIDRDNACAAFPDIEIELDIKKEDDTWIKCGLKQFNEKFDYITIPYQTIIPFRTDTARLQRDAKRFRNIIRTIAWICQKQRYRYEYGGYKILVADMEDCVWAHHLTKQAFLYSIGESTPDLDLFYETTKTMVDKEGENIFNDQSRVPQEMIGLSYIDRSKVQKKLGITNKTAKSRQEALENKGLMESFSPYSHSRTYIRVSNLVGNHPLIGWKSVDILNNLKKYEKIIYEKHFLTYSQPNSNLLPTGLLTKLTTTTPYIATKLEEHDEKTCSKFEKLSYEDALSCIYSEIATNLKRNGQEAMYQNGKFATKEKSPILQEVKKIKEYINSFKDTKDFCCTEQALYDNFTPSTITHLRESNQLIINPKTQGVEWND